MERELTLNNGVKMPTLGLGVFKVGDGSPVKNAIKSALRYGYRMIDTAAVYGNETGVGEALQESSLKRNELFLTTKVWNGDQGYDSTLKAFDESLRKLQTDYVDLYLIHWPVATKFLETWRALQRLYEEGQVRAIGVSNFQIYHLQELLQNSAITPAVNQIENHPLLSQVELRRFCQQQGIVVEAWSPLMKGNLEIPAIVKLAEEHQKTPAQIVLRWHLQNGVVVIPKSVHDYRIRENSQIFDFSLTPDEMEIINSLNQNKRFGPDPDNFSL
ncbi:MAG: aldo/keto reductase [Sphaerochaetaceae bacterium]